MTLFCKTNNKPLIRYLSNYKKFSYRNILLHFTQPLQIVKKQKIGFRPSFQCGSTANQVFLNGSETSETLLQAELYVAKLSLKCRYLFGNFCKFLAPKTKTVNKNIVMKVNFLKKLSI